MNMQTALRTVVSALLLAPAASAWAHPGHGDETTLLGLLHLLEPVHLLPVMAVVAGGLVLRRVLRRHKESRDQDKA